MNMDQVHHIIPKKKWGDGLRKLRNQADKWGLDLDDADNLVALPTQFHQQATQSERYLDRLKAIQAAVENGVIKNKSELIEQLNAMAEQLLKESGKLK